MSFAYLNAFGRDWSKTELLRLMVSDQTLVLDFGLIALSLVSDFDLRPKLSVTSVFA